MATSTLALADISDLDALCQAMAPYIHPPMVIGLTGDMGSGKTTFVRQLGRALGSTDWINSPTYTLIQEYQAPIASIIHVDLYRCESDADIDHLDLSSYMNNHTVMLIEWAPLDMPIDLYMQFDYLGDTKRRCTISSTTCTWIQTLHGLNQADSH